jgi:hypothetical protein
MAMPLLMQPDEPSHAMRAAAVARGQLTWKDREDVSFDEFLRARPTRDLDPAHRYVRRTNTVVDIPEGYASLETVPVCVAIEDGNDASCAPEVSSSSTIVEARPYTGTYPPLTAIVESPGGRFDAPVGLVVMRLCTVLVAAALLSTGVVAVRRLGGGFTAVGFALVLTPVTLSLTAAINPSALEIASAACLWPSLLDVARPGPVDRGAVWRTVAAACVLILSRPLSPAIFVAIVATVMIATPWREPFRAICRERRAWVWGLIVAVAFVFAVTWIVVARPDQAVVGLPDPRGATDVLRDSLSRIPKRTGELIGPIGWLDIPLPGWFVAAWLALAGLLALTGFVLGSWRRRLALLMLLAGTLVGPALAEWPSADEFGLIWQGRYTLPLAMGLTILGGWTVHEQGVDRRRAMRALGVVVVAAIALANLLAVGAALSRHATGTSWPLDIDLGAQPWSADVRGWVVLTVAACGLAVVAAVLSRMTARPRDPTGIS